MTQVFTVLSVFVPDVARAFPNLFSAEFVPQDCLDFFLSATKSAFEERKSSQSVCQI